MDQNIPVWVQWSFNVVLMLIGGLVTWSFKALGSKIEALERREGQLTSDMTELRVQMPTYYVQKADHDKSLERIFGVLERIEQKLNDKVDKS